MPLAVDARTSRARSRTTAGASSRPTSGLRPRASRAGIARKSEAATSEAAAIAAAGRQVGSGIGLGATPFSRATMSSIRNARPRRRGGASGGGGRGLARVEGRDHVAERLEAIGRSLGEHAQDDPLEPLGHVGAQVARARRRLGHVGEEDVGELLLVEREAAAQELEEGHAERVLVAARVELEPVRLLGRHEVRRPRDRRRDEELVLGRDGEPEVDDLHLAVGGEHEVGGLDVAVQELLRVRVVEALGRLAREAHGLVDRELPLALVPEVVDRAALEELHDEEVVPALRPVDVEDADDVGVVEPEEDPRLGRELLDESGARDQLLVEDLDRDVAVEAEVTRPVDSPHAALAELGEDPAAADHLAGRDHLGDHRRRRARRRGNVVAHPARGDVRDRRLGRAVE